MTPVLPQASVRFRGKIIEALIEVDAERFWHLTENIVAGVCPLCHGVLSVYFHGTAPRADLVCHGGCTEPEVLDALKRGWR